MLRGGRVWTFLGLPLRKVGVSNLLECIPKTASSVAAVGMRGAVGEGDCPPTPLLCLWLGGRKPWASGQNSLRVCKQLRGQLVTAFGLWGPSLGC